MSNYQSRNGLVQNRQLKVQRLVIPFQITGNASSASVVVSRDEPAILFLATQGVNQITPAYDSTTIAPTIANAPNDSTGTINLMLSIQEPVGKVMAARVVRTDVVNAQYQCQLENGGTGIVLDSALVTPYGANGGDCIILSATTLALNGSNVLNATLECEYVVSEIVDPTSLFS
jgi:hypothetical protein